jgi:hypothetical protein
VSENQSSSDAKCVRLNIPSHLHSLGRPVETNFDTSEVVYYRIPREDLFPTINSAAFRFPRTSVLWSKLCASPEDALYDGERGNHRLDWGGVAMCIGDIRRISRTHPDKSIKKDYSFDVEHVPLDCVYPHCEILTKLGGTEATGGVCGSYKTWLRDELKNISKIVHDPIGTGH